MIKTEKIKEKLKNIWDSSEKPVPFKVINEIVDYAVSHENMESGTFQKHIKTILDKVELEEE